MILRSCRYCGEIWLIVGYKATGGRMINLRYLADWHKDINVHVLDCRSEWESLVKSVERAWNQ